MAVNGAGAGAGAASGAASGAAIGTLFGPGYGTAIGAGVGALAGGLMGSGMLGGGEGATVKTHIPEYMKKPASQIGYGVDWVLNATRHGLNPSQQAGLDAMRARAEQGTGLGQLPTDLINQTVAQGGLDPRTTQFGEGVLSGAMNNPMRGQAEWMAQGGDLGSNPHLDATYNRAARGLTQSYQDTVSPGMTSQAASRGRLGSGAYARMRNNAEGGLATGLGDLANQVYGGAYEQDKSRQMQAMGLGGQLAQQDMGNAFNAASLFDTGLNRTLSTIGMTPAAMAAQYADAQQLLDVGNLQNDLLFRPFQTAGQALQGLPFAQSQTTSQSVNPLVQGLGIGAGLYSTFKPQQQPAGGSGYGSDWDRAIAQMGGK